MALKKNGLVSELFDTDKPICMFDLIGSCRGNCRNTHIEKTKTVNALIRCIKDPTRLIDRNKLRDAVSSKLKTKKQIYFTTCIFCIQGKGCRNEQNNRHVRVNVEYQGEDIEFDVCYGDTKRAKNRIMCGLHLDYQYEVKRGYFKITNIHNYIVPPPPTEEEIATENMKAINFPDLKGNTNNKYEKKDDEFWCEKESEKIPKPKEKVVPNRKEVTNLEMDKSNRFINPISFRVKDFMDFNEVDYELLDTPESTNDEKHELLHAMSQVVMT